MELLDIYRAHPGRTLPNAYWKTAIHLGEARVTLTRDAVGELSSLAIWEGGRLMALWCADPTAPRLTREEIATVPFALVHADALPVFAQREFTLRRPYFRLVYRGRSQEYTLPAGFAFEPVRPAVDIASVVNLIRACYPTININPAMVQAWLDHPVYDPDLWLWIVDLDTGNRAGLGIAERDPQVPEVSLEWIQVLPAYQKMGLGKALVTELTRRASDSVRFITVAGEANNPHQPERLYRGCGFTGTDVWWLLADEG